MSEKNKTIKKQLTELEAITAWFSSDDFDIEQAVKQYETAKKLLDDITKQLESLKNQIVKLWGWSCVLDIKFNNLVKASSFWL